MRQRYSPHHNRLLQASMLAATVVTAGFLGVLPVRAADEVTHDRLLNADKEPGNWSFARSRSLSDLHLRFDCSSFLKNNGAHEFVALGESLTGLQQHHVMAVGFEGDGASGGDRDRGDRAHGGRSFTAIDGVPFREIRHRTSDTHQGIGNVRIVLDRHQKWHVATDCLGHGNPGFGDDKRLVSRAFGRACVQSQSEHGDGHAGGCEQPAV